jgi:predicted  nucleic acid-binding Zn-ribbon protein
MSIENQYRTLQQEYQKAKHSIAAYDRALKKSQKSEKNLAKENKKLKQEVDKLNRKLKAIAKTVGRA